MHLFKCDLENNSFKISNNRSRPNYFIYQQSMPSSFIENHWIHAVHNNTIA